MIIHVLRVSIHQLNTSSCFILVFVAFSSSYGAFLPLADDLRQPTGEPTHGSSLLLLGHQPDVSEWILVSRWREPTDLRLLSVPGQSLLNAQGGGDRRCAFAQILLLPFDEEVRGVYVHWFVLYDLSLFMDLT